MLRVIRESGGTLAIGIVCLGLVAIALYFLRTQAEPALRPWPKIWPSLSIEAISVLIEISCSRFSQLWQRAKLLRRRATANNRVVDICGDVTIAAGWYVVQVAATFLKADEFIGPSGLRFSELANSRNALLAINMQYGVDLPEDTRFQLASFQKTAYKIQDLAQVELLGPLLQLEVRGFRVLAQQYAELLGTVLDRNARGMLDEMDSVSVDLSAARNWWNELGVLDHLDPKTELDERLSIGFPLTNNHRIITHLYAASRALEPVIQNVVVEKMAEDQKRTVEDLERFMEGVRDLFPT